MTAPNRNAIPASQPPIVPTGWTNISWAGRLRRLASRCQQDQPNLAIQYREHADKLDPPRPPTTDQDRRDRVLKRAGKDIRAAIEMFKNPEGNKRA